MISIYTGTPGSGKSYHVALRVWRALRSRRIKLIVSNVDFSIPEKYREKLIVIDNFHMTKQRLENIISERMQDGDKIREGQFLLVLDEAQLLFNARAWQATDSKGWIEFFTQHRKMGYDVLLVSQSDGMIDKQIRSLIEYEVLHRKVVRFGLIGIFFKIFFGDFIAISCWYGVRQKVDTEFLRYRRKIGKLYNTYQIWHKT